MTIIEGERLKYLRTREDAKKRKEGDGIVKRCEE